MGKITHLALFLKSKILTIYSNLLKVLLVLPLRLFLAAGLAPAVHLLQYDSSQPEPFPQQGGSTTRQRSPTASET